jgi:hypothetical protein
MRLLPTEMGTASASSRSSGLRNLHEICNRLERPLLDQLGRRKKKRCSQIGDTLAFR